MDEQSTASADVVAETTADPLFEAASALRDLVDVFTDRELDDALLAEITAAAEALTAKAAAAPHWDRQALLEASINDPDRTDGRRGGFYYRAIAGPANPAALPIELDFGTDEVTAEITLRPMHSGAPGRGHGGVLAGILDEFAGTAPWLVRAMAATARLSVNFRAPIPIGEPIRLRTWVHEKRGRKIYVRADARRGDVVLADAEGLFIEIDYGAIDTSGAARH